MKRSLLFVCAVAIGACAAPEEPSAPGPKPQFDGGTSGTVTFDVRGMTFTTSGGFSTDYERPDCFSYQLGWIVYWYPGAKLVQACRAIAPLGGGEYLNGGQIQVDGTVGSESGAIASISADLRQDFTAIEYPDVGTVTFYGQAADGNCSFDQWRINSGGSTTSSTENPMTMQPTTGTTIVGWFVCSGGGGGGFLRRP